MSRTESHTPVFAGPSSARSASRPLVLVIDPDASARSVLEVALAREGFDVWSSGSGAEGLALLKGRAPDVVVLEADLGGEDGYSFVAELRGDERTATLPVLLLARPDDRNVAALAEVVGVDDFIHKPAFARDVAALVRLELARRAGGPRVAFESPVLPPEQLLRALLASPRAGRLVLAEGRAELVFAAGLVTDARFDTRPASMETLVRALALTTGRYELELGPVGRPGSLRCGLRELVQGVMPRLGQWTRLLQRSLPLGARFAVDFRHLAQALPAMPDGINQVVQLFDGVRTVRDVLADSALDESITLEAATRLYLTRVLAPASGEPQELLVPKAMPRLFEPRPTEIEEISRELFAGSAPQEPAEPTPADIATEWYQPPGGQTGLELADPSGGWTTAPVPADLAAGLDPALARQLAAFHIPVRVEAAEPSVEAQQVRTFARGPLAVASDAMTQAFEAGMAQRAAEEPLEAQIDAQRAEASDAQARIDTPWMTPIVAPEALPAGPTPAPLSVEVDRAALEDAAAQAEAAFFAEREAHGLEELPATERVKRVWPVMLAGTMVVLAAVLIESLRRPVVVPAAPAPAAVSSASIPDVEEPTLYVEAAEEVVPLPDIEEPELYVEPAPLDVSEDLALARRAYEAGRFRKAIAILEGAVQADPSSVNAWLLLGLARYDAGDVAGAREAAARVLALDATNARVQILLATLHFDAGRAEQGRAALARYLELEPTGPHAAEARALLGR